MAATTTSPTLSFPREIFAVLSPGPFLQAHLTPQLSTQSPIRANGRTPHDFRPPSINTGSLTHCSGSAVVRIGDTAAVCGVRGEILLASDIPNPPSDTTTTPPSTSPAVGRAAIVKAKEELASLGLLIPNIELATGSTPQNLPGAPPSTLAQSLTARLLSLLHDTALINPADLRILYKPPPLDTADDSNNEEDEEEPQTIAYWALYIDILFISLDGNAFDAAWAAVLAALHDTKLPKAWWDPDAEQIICSDAVEDARRLALTGLPVAATFAVFDPKDADARRFAAERAEEQTGEGEGQGAENQTWILVDPDAFEESLCLERVTVVVDCSQGGDGGSSAKQIRRIEKHGGGVVGREYMRELVQLAVTRWAQWEQCLNQPRRP